MVRRMVLPRSFDAGFAEIVERKALVKGSCLEIRYRVVVLSFLKSGGIR
jgi:hypothetical protein